MTQVSTQAELQAAIAAQETNIEVTADFKIDTSQRITYAATVSSGAGGPYTLAKAEGHNGSLFFIENNGSLTLANIILDGDKVNPSSFSTTGSLIWVHTGTLILDTGTVLQNNPTVQGGGNVSCNGETSPINIIMRGDAVIRNNVADNGGEIEVTEILLGSTGDRTLYPRQKMFPRPKRCRWTLVLPCPKNCPPVRAMSSPDGIPNPPAARHISPAIPFSSRGI